MPRQRAVKPKSRTAKPVGRTNALGSTPAAEALSFLRQTRGLSTWTAGDLVRTLNISLADAQQVISILALQGYIKPSAKNKLMTTLSGESVSGSKIPRFTPERVEKALADLRSRIAEINRDSRAAYEITEAVAFGDFLQHRTRVQPAEMGIQLKQRPSDALDSGPAEERKRHAAFLKQVRGKGGVLQVRRFESWMSARTHRQLL